MPIAASTTGAGAVDRLARGEAGAEQGQAARERGQDVGHQPAHRHPGVRPQQQPVDRHEDHQMGADHGDADGRQPVRRGQQDRRRRRRRASRG